MKPAPFDYALATSIDEAARLLADADGDAVVPAGGQTLAPMLAMRLARPGLVVDINEIAELSGTEETGDAAEGAGDMVAELRGLFGAIGARRLTRAS